MEQATWYAIHTRSRQERIAARVLENLGIRVFLPLITEVHRWSDRKKEVSVPLFASYLFVQIPSTRESQVRVLKAPGVVNFVGNQSGPLSIPEREIDDVRSVLSERADCAPCAYLKIGERVRIIGGALDGIEGTLVGTGPDKKLVISIELIQRSMAVSVYGFNVKPVGNARSAAA